MNVSSEKKIFIQSNACQRRNLDAKKVSVYLNINDCRIVDDPKEADYIIFFTCAFLNTVADRCIEAIKKLKEYDAELIVAGCLPDIAPEKLKEVFDGKIITTTDMDRIDAIFDDNKIKLSCIDDVHSGWRNFNPLGISKQPIGFFKKVLDRSRFLNKIYRGFSERLIRPFFGQVYPFNILLASGSNSYTISISRGCIHNCSYCSIRKAVGPLKSKPVSQCVKEFKEGLEKRYTEFILEADDIGIYGIDIKSSLPKLLDELTKFEGNYNIILRNTHPQWIIKYINELEEIIKRKKIKNILVSIQSGSDRILKLMRRHYKTEDLIDAIHRLKKAYPDLEISTHLLVGFPTETMKDFEETLDLFKKIHIDRGLVLSFSLSDETPAAAMEPKISKKETYGRMKIAVKFLKNTNYFAWYTNIIKGISFERKS